MKNILSNSCVGYEIYGKGNIYYSPLIGSMFLDDYMYLTFLENYDHYTEIEPAIKVFSKEAYFADDNRIEDYYLLMTLDDVKIHWIHKFEKDIDVLLDNWNRRISRSKDLDRIFTWSTSEFFNIHTDKERKEIINRFCNLPGLTVLLTEREHEAIDEKETVIKYLAGWHGASQTDRHPWGFLKWDNQAILRDKTREIINNH